MCFIPSEHPLLKLADQLDLSDQARDLLASKHQQESVNKHALQHIVSKATVTTASPSQGNGGLALSIYTMHNKTVDATDPTKKLEAPGDKLMDSHGMKPTGTDEARDKCYKTIHSTWDFYNQVFQRNSLDGHGLEIRASIHVGENSADAFWDPNHQQIFFGDGGTYDESGKTTSKLSPLTIDVVGHELTHGVVSKTAGLQLGAGNFTLPSTPAANATWTPELTKAMERFPNEEHDMIKMLGPFTFAALINNPPIQASATLNEHIADCFGVMVKQWSQGQTAEHADWTIATGWWSTETMQTQGWGSSNYMRTFLHPDSGMKQPDTSPKAWKDTIEMYVTSDPHRFCGIGNHAFYQAALKFGGESWKSVGKIWYSALIDDSFRNTKNQTYQGWRNLTIAHAKNLFGETGAQKMTEAWKMVNL